MWLELVLAAGAVPAGGLGAAVAFAKRTRHPLMLQWGHFVNHRPGLKNDKERVSRLKQEGLLPLSAGFDGWADEPDLVEFEDYRYWLRLRPNPGINLPLVGYWSRARGRRRMPRPWEGR